MSNILEAENLNITYDEETHAVIDLTLSLGYGEILTVVGGSGSGKSTFLHSAIGLLSKDAEKSKILLQTLKEQISRERKIHKRQIWQNRIWCLLIGAGIGYAASN